MRQRALLTGCLLFSCVWLHAATEPPVLPNATLEANISYDQYPQTRLDIYIPKSAPKGKRPGAIVIHGGGWVNGTKESMAEKFVAPLIDQGFVVANVEYRLAAVAPAPAAVSDVLKAADWFRDNARRWNVDNGRVIVLGGSAGGHLSLMVGMTPKSAKLGPTSKIAAVINFYGITDVEDQLQGPNMRKYAVTWVPEQENRADLARRVSPMTYVRKDVPAVLSLHGTADETVPYDHSVHLTKGLRDEGADAEMISVPGGRHGFTPEEMKKLWPQIFDFLRRRGILKQAS